MTAANTGMVRQPPAWMGVPCFRDTTPLDVAAPGWDDVDVAVPIRLGVVDDHWAIAEGVFSRLAAVLDLGAGSRCSLDVAAMLEDGRPLDVVVLDVELADDSSAESNVARLVERGVSVVLYTREQRPTVLGRCVQAGALALVDKSEPPETLVEAVVAVAAGEPFLNAHLALVMEWMAAGRAPHLSPREIDVLTLFANGLPAKSVASRVGITEDTVNEYLKRIREKYLDVGRPARSKVELYQRAVEDGHLPPPTARSEKT